MTTSVIHVIAAARPNFMKVAPLFHALGRASWCRAILVHTGQHYDSNMSDAFFRDLTLPAPDFHLGVGSGSHAEQTGGVMIAYERICLEARPDWTIVVGDVNSTMACTVAAAKLGIPVAHLEAGLRSRDRTMPEEINRIVTDSLADVLWTPSRDADDNLRAEGVPDGRVTRVGNIMIDAYELLRDRIEAAQTRARFGLPAKAYGVVTLHRPANVDDPRALGRLVAELTAVSAALPLVFPCHPRTRQRLAAAGLLEGLSKSKGLSIVEPMGYIEFMGLVTDARLVITDSGGVQEETTYLDIPCLTVRTTTERPITVLEGTNQLVSVEALGTTVDRVRRGEWQKGRCPELWDGQTAGRVVLDLRRRSGMPG
jgi:UDP-N-acetylglucosamine 2-epimerase (non-hydrolysing)